MRVFKYAGQNRAGEVVDGVIEASNKVEALKLLQEQDVTCTTLETALGVIPKSQKASRDPVSGRFVKRLGTKEAVKCVAKDIIDQPMLDQVGDLSAQIMFKHIYKVENGKIEELEKTLLMQMEFDQTGEKRETVVSEKYCFVPNNVILDAAKNLPGAVVKTRYFNTLYYGTLTQDDLSIQITNSYGGYQAFRLTPILKIDDIDIPVFVSTKQIHHGSSAGFEVAVRETLSIASALRDGQQQLLSVLSAPITPEDWVSYDAKISASAASDTRQLPKQVGKQYLVFRAEQPNATYADLLKFIVTETKAYMDRRKFSPGVEKRSVNLINDILSNAKVLSQLKDVLKNNVPEELLHEATRKIQQQLKSTTASGLKL